MSQKTLPEILDFVADLRCQGAADKTTDDYATDLANFARWFTESTGEAFTARAVTPTDLLDYKAYLRTAQQRQAATVNRRLAALRKFYLWAKGTGRITDLPTETVKGVPLGPRVPKALAKREVDRLLRMAEREGNKRNLAIVLLLRHTGVRVGELCNLRIGDITISERKGHVLIRSGKGDKDRSIPLNNDIRQALAAYVAARPQGKHEHAKDRTQLTRR